MRVKSWITGPSRLEETSGDLLLPHVPEGILAPSGQVSSFALCRAFAEVMMVSMASSSTHFSLFRVRDITHERIARNIHKAQDL